MPCRSPLYPGMSPAWQFRHQYRGSGSTWEDLSTSNLSDTLPSLLLQATADPFAQLPGSALSLILQFVPLQQRLTQCALVCSSWSAAAVLATVCVEHKLQGTAIQSCEAWLQQYGKQLQSLALAAASYTCNTPQLQLPWAELKRLQKLHLSKYRLQLPAGTAEACTTTRSPNSGSAALQELALHDCTLSSASCLLQLGHGQKHLTRLGLDRPFMRGLEHAKTDVRYRAVLKQLQAVMEALLQQLPQLSVLQLKHIDIGPAAVQHLSAMTRLQDLTLHLGHSMDGSCLRVLPSSLTRLAVEGRMYAKRGAVELELEMTPLPRQFEHLSALQHMQLTDCGIPPSLLGTVTQLSYLHLSGCKVLPVGPDDLQDIRRTAALLEALPKFTRLQHLHLGLMNFDTTSQAPESFAALTAPPQLTALILWPEVGQPLPVGVVHKSMFTKGRVMPRLKHLTIATCQDIAPWAHAGVHRNKESCIGTQDLTAIFNCCPNLESLDLSDTFDSDADLSVLLRLPQSCTELSVSQPQPKSDSVPVLRQLTQLKDLDWREYPGLNPLSLQQLTALHGLSCLRVLTCFSLGNQAEFGQYKRSDNFFSFCESADKVGFCTGLPPALACQHCLLRLLALGFVCEERVVLCTRRAGGCFAQLQLCSAA